MVGELPETCWPFALNDLPRNGIYFFHETGETWGHGGGFPRVVRVGTHREGNFASRMADHFVTNERKMDFNANQAAPKDRSIFRKNLGRAILNREKDPYLAVWEIDFTTRAARETQRHLRDLEKERTIEHKVTKVLRERFSFRWIKMDGQERRMGTGGFESALIGTLSTCGKCSPSGTWLGRYSPKPKISQSGLWLEQHLGSPGLSVEDLNRIAQGFLESRGRGT